MPLVSLTIAVLLLALSAPLAGAADPIRIGAVVSATGPASFLGEPEKNTLAMQAEAINAAGGLLGRPHGLRRFWPQ